MSMSLPRLGALVFWHAGQLHKKTRDYCTMPGYTSKETLETDIKNVMSVLDLFEQELQKFDIFTDTRTDEVNE